MRYRPKRENYAVGQFGKNDYQEMLERYCTYLENQNKQLRIGVVSQQRELLLAWEEYSCELEYLTPNYEVLEENINDFLANNCG